MIARKKNRPRFVFVDGVWVGKISGIGFVVYDSAIENLYSYEENPFFSEEGLKEITTKISLWVYETRRRQYFEVVTARYELRSNIQLISESERYRIARAYHDWIHELLVDEGAEEILTHTFSQCGEAESCEPFNGTGRYLSSDGINTGLCVPNSGEIGEKPKVMEDLYSEIKKKENESIERFYSEK